MGKTVRTTIHVQAKGGKNARIKKDQSYFEFIVKFPYGSCRAWCTLSNSEIEEMTTEGIAKSLQDAIWETMREITGTKGGAK